MVGAGARVAEIRTPPVLVAQAKIWLYRPPPSYTTSPVLTRQCLVESKYASTFFNADKKENNMTGHGWRETKKNKGVIFFAGPDLKGSSKNDMQWRCRTFSGVYEYAIYIYI
eukprot:GEMP01013942.1.p1 GENE.GEMP01013942.1~~GEMP01013942.1.p1  ORF type:complete len:112 (+),score=0.02 GEMP01013942.1:1752-2087(+)